jgi:hypothetical protein
MDRSRPRSRRLGPMVAGALLGLALLAAVLPSGPRSADRPARAGADPDPAPAAPERTELRVRRPARPPAAEDVPAELAAAAPAPEDPSAEARPLLVIDVVDEDGRPAEGATVMSIDCAGFHGGPPGAYRVDAGPCILRAARRDGALLSRGAAASIDVRGADPVYLQLELPSQRTGGIGIRFLPVDQGVEVLDVRPGTPAWDAGLERGDLIVAVGGEDVAGKDSEWFVDRMTGAVGSEVEFTIGFEGDTGFSREVVRVTRAFLEI